MGLLNNAIACLPPGLNLETFSKFSAVYHIHTCTYAILPVLKHVVPSNTVSRYRYMNCFGSQILSHTGLLTRRMCRKTIMAEPGSTIISHHCLSSVVRIYDFMSIFKHTRIWFYAVSIQKI